VALPDLDPARVEAELPDAERVLFKTPNSELWAGDSFAEDALSFDADGARVLVQAGVRLVGVDYLSVGDAEAHRALLGAGIVVVEGLDLRGVEAGEYELVCLPLRVVGADGAPARAVLLRR
jgi:arylformamidase